MPAHEWGWWPNAKLVSSMHRGTDRASSPDVGQPLTERWEFPGRVDQVPRARRLVATTLRQCPAGADAVLLTNELITNAVVHSTSGRNGLFTVTLTHRIADLRVEVADQGGPWIPDGAGHTEHGRGLLIVSNLARAWGVTGDDSGRTVWFELDCP